MKIRTVYVYGTLRPGESNYWIEPAVQSVVEEATTEGQLWLPRHKSFPIAVFGRPGTVTGTLLYMDEEHEEFSYMYGMEIGASYEPVTIDVLLPDGTDVQNVLAFERAPTPNCRQITSGDWKSSGHSDHEYEKRKALRDA